MATKRSVPKKVDDRLQEWVLKHARTQWPDMPQRVLVFWHQDKKMHIRFKAWYEALDGTSRKHDRSKTNCDFFAEALLPPDTAGDLLLSLDDLFEKWVKSYGRRRALIIYATQIAGTILHHYGSGLIKFFGGIFGVGLFRKLWAFWAR
jgi:hypothetical protein